MPAKVKTTHSREKTEVGVVKRHAHFKKQNKTLAITDNPIKNWSEDLDRIFPEKKYRWPTGM